MFEFTQYRRCSGCGCELAGKEHTEQQPGIYFCNECTSTREGEQTDGTTDKEVNLPNLAEPIQTETNESNL